MAAANVREAQEATNDASAYTRRAEIEQHGEASLLLTFRINTRITLRDGLAANMPDKPVFDNPRNLNEKDDADKDQQIVEGDHS